MVEIFNYWKTFCSPKIVIKAGFLNEHQINWWKKLLIKGMGQYFYENKIDFTTKNFVDFTTTGQPLKVEPLKVLGEEVLIPIGGGKDSAVTLELVTKNFENSLGLIVNKIKARVDSASVAGIKTMVVKRTLDKAMIDLNKNGLSAGRQGYLNGHVPFTTVLSFISILVAFLNNKKYIAFSNEQSSNEGNVTFKGLSVNHQYSKSFELENDFREYNFKYLTDIEYFSFLRPIYDIQIAKVFSQYSKYFYKIVSCNIGRNNNIWCGKCPKCLSTFILFKPFLKNETITIFGKDLLADKSLKPVLDALTNDNLVKPMECVGTKHELRVALGVENDDNLINFWGENNLPAIFKIILYFNLNFKDKKILILGYGREGKSTEKLIKKYLPKQKVDIADQKLSKDYLKDLNNYDFVFKSPGIPNKLREIQNAKKMGTVFASQTKIFLKLYRDNVIGVTGTKGKSTTSSLIYYILKSAGINTTLVGNIGKPVFDYLDNDDKDKIFVAELSSHQLSDVQDSPHIAVLLNIFPEHLDYYEDFNDYKKSKENIFKFQKSTDIYISCEDINNFELPKIKTNLIGQHNLSNIKAAFLVALKLGIDKKDIIKALSTFESLEDRLETIREINGIKFIVDGLATIPEASLAGIDSFENKNITLILGGFDRGVSFASFGKELIKRKNIKNIILIGQTADKIEKSLKNSKANVYNLGFVSMNKIIQKAFEISKKDYIVLFSPAATSFDMFKDYEERDNQFKEAVKALK